MAKIQTKNEIIVPVITDGEHKEALFFPGAHGVEMVFGNKNYFITHGDWDKLVKMVPLIVKASKIPEEPEEK